MRHLVHRLCFCLPLIWGAAAFVAACVTYTGVRAAPITRSADSVVIRTPVKAHLLDGITVTYPEGVTLARGYLWGHGNRYSLTLVPMGAVEAVPLDSVLAMESFQVTVDAGKTIVVSTLATAGTLLATGVLLVAIFGSCPTIYADSAGRLVLQAESFSYSIAPLFEARDVDGLRVTPDPDGVIRLELRNEALETHYLNHLALLEVDHSDDELVFPDGQGRPLAVRALVPVERAVDRSGHDVTTVLRDADGAVYRTDTARLATVGAGDVDDAIDLTVPTRVGADSVVLILRLRNSLLNTVLLYDEMLGARGARSLDWLGRDLGRIGDALELGQWYRTVMGLRVAVWNGTTYAPVSRLPDVGPIAYKDVAVTLPVPPGQGTLHVRLSFVADDWRIDRVAVAGAWRSPSARTLRLRAIRDAHGTPLSDAGAALDSADSRYFQTLPGQRFTLEFQTEPTAGARTFLLVSQGYYIEWVRGRWIATGRDSTRFTPGEPSLLAALGAWRLQQTTLEARFAAARVPVR